MVCYLTVKTLNGESLKNAEARHVCFLLQRSDDETDVAALVKAADLARKP
jgi:hypothetical protein